MNRAVRILLYIVGSVLIILGLFIFGIGIASSVFIAGSFLIVGALFFIGGIVVIWSAARTRKTVNRQGAWRFA